MLNSVKNDAVFVCSFVQKRTTVRIYAGFGSSLFYTPGNQYGTGKMIRQIHPYRLTQAKFSGGLSC